jgi:hypothetical protein
MFRWLLWAFAAATRPKVLLVADNLCLRQHWRSCSAARHGRASRMRTGVSGFWRVGGSAASEALIKPETVLWWHRSWRTYWRWRSRRTGRPGRRAIKHEKPNWGARKIRELLIRRLPGDIRVPAKSTIHAVLHRHGLVAPLARPRRRATGTPLSRGLAPNEL